ncbi:hypothetical protein ACFRIC_29470 [Streptomyces sp. NPDC056738]|uniref:hypothetical protein n=1 Tax=Streptomyces sp. NPDC056738 TaxID=3345933 RepID=UPI0036D1C930
MGVHDWPVNLGVISMRPGDNEAMLDLGWAAAGSIAPPYSRHWEAEGIRFNVFEGAGGWCADVLFREVWPEDEEDLGSDAVAKACEVEGKFR